MDTDTFNSLVSSVEQNIYKYDHEYVNAFIAIKKEHDKVLTTEQHQWLDAEVAAFTPRTTDTTRNKKQHRFKDYEFSDEQLAQYSDRVKSCTNPKMVQRYYDILWEKFKTGNRKEIGEGLVKSSIELAGILNHDNEFEKQDCINRALQVADLIEKNAGQLINSAHQAVLDYLGKQQTEGNIRYTLEIIDTIISFSQLFQKADFELSAKLCDEGIGHFETVNNNFTLKGAFIERKYQVAKLIDPSKFDNKARVLELVQVQIDEAHRRTDSVMVQQHFLTIAEKLLKDAGLNDKAAEVRKEVIALGKSEEYEKQFQQFSYETVIPQGEIDKLEKLLTDYPDTAAVIILSPNFMTKWSEAKAEADKSPASTTDIFTSTIVDDNGMTIAIETDDERKKVMRYFQSIHEFKLSVLASLFKKLRKEKLIKLKDFKAQFGKIKGIDKDCWESVKYGLQLFLKGKDYEASIILTTQLENLLYCMLPIMEVDQYIFEKDGKTQSPKTMSWFLSEIKEAISDDAYELLTYSLVDKGHINLRNKVGHGKTNINSNNLLACVRLIQLFGVVLIMLNVEKRNRAKYS